MKKNSVVILNVGHGNASIINDDNKYYLIDTGKSTRIITYLRENNITEIQKIFISHSDIDHLGQLTTLLVCENLIIHEIYITPDAQKETASWNDILEILRQQSEANQTISNLTGACRTQYPLTNYFLEVISPNIEILGHGVGADTKAGEEITCNTVSTFLALKRGTDSFISFTADIDEVAINNISKVLLSNTKSKYMVFPHHGGKCNTQNYLEAYEKLLTETQPKYVIISNGNKEYKNPRKEVIDTIKKVLPDTEILCLNLSVNCSDCADKICSGDVIIDLETNEILKPNFLKYIEERKLIVNRLCK